MGELIGPAVTDGPRRPMLYSAGSLEFIESIRLRLGQALRRHALDLAREDGRDLVTEDDVRAAMRRVALDDVMVATGRGDGDPMAETTAGESFPELERLCPACEGTEGTREMGHWRPCPECLGAGYLPTEIGRKVLALMRHNFRPMLRP